MNLLRALFHLFAQYLLVEEHPLLRFEPVPLSLLAVTTLAHDGRARC